MPDSFTFVYTAKDPASDEPLDPLDDQSRDHIDIPAPYEVGEGCADGPAMAPTRGPKVRAATITIASPTLK